MTGLRRNRWPAADLRVLFSSGSLGGLPDGELLERYVSRRDEAVFEAIVRRHGPMVWGVCRRVLRDHHDAEDAFQATFLVLARRASSIVPREKLPNWLHGVACQTARKARAGILRRRGREGPVAMLPEPAAESREARDDVRPLIDEELRRLPETYRAPVVLCDLEGMTHRQAAAQLGWPVGTVSGRLSRARALLAGRLSRRGVAVPGGVLAVLLSREAASAAVPPAMIAITTRAASVFAADRRAAGAVVSAKAAGLTKGVLRSMWMSKLKAATAVLMGLVGLMASGANPAGSGERPGPAKSGAGVKRVATAAPLKLREAAGDRMALTPQEEMKRFEGIWAITSVAEGGHLLPPEEATRNANGIGRVTFRGNQMTLNFRANNARSAVTFRFWVDPARSPGSIAIIPPPQRPDDDEENVPIYLGIYELTGDTLKLAFGVDRPEKIEPGTGDDRMMLVLKWAFPLKSP